MRFRRSTVGEDIPWLGHVRDDVPQRIEQMKGILVVDLFRGLAAIVEFPGIGPDLVEQPVAVVEHKQPIQFHQSVEPLDSNFTLEVAKAMRPP